MPTVKNRQLPLTIPTNLILAFSWEKGIKKKWIGGRAVEVCSKELRFFLRFPLRALVLAPQVLFDGESGGILE